MAKKRGQPKIDCEDQHHSNLARHFKYKTKSGAIDFVLGWRITLQESCGKPIGEWNIFAPHPPLTGPPTNPYPWQASAIDTARALLENFSRCVQNLDGDELREIADSIDILKARSKDPAYPVWEAVNWIFFANPETWEISNNQRTQLTYGEMVERLTKMIKIKPFPDERTLRRICKKLGIRLVKDAVGCPKEK